MKEGGVDHVDELVLGHCPRFEKWNYVFLDFVVDVLAVF